MKVQQVKSLLFLELIFLNPDPVRLKTLHIFQMLEHNVFILTVTVWCATYGFFQSEDGEGDVKATWG